jgi:AhpD family alkylhydroperoxidase
MKPMRRLARAYARLRYGTVPEPLDNWYPHGGVFWTWSTTESMVEATWRHLPANIRDLAVLETASVIDCPWCLDFGSHVATKNGLSEAKIRDLHNWRASDAYDEDERLAIELAEQMSATPVEIDPELVDRARERFGPKGFVELTASIALEHQRSRFNKATGAMPQGWSRVCALPTASQPTSGDQGHKATQQVR